MSCKKSVSVRKISSLPDNPYRFSKARSALSGSRKNEEINKLIKYTEDNVVGKNNTFSGPYGRRKVIYCDYTTSGRSLQFIEDYIIKEVLPSYGNTHTTTSVTSLQSTLFRHEARDIIRTYTHASDKDVVIFAGHGCFGAVNKLISGLDLQEPPVVFVGPSENHTNLLPWREHGAKIIRISETKEGFLDLNNLESQLINYQGCGFQLIGFFSAASNVTGIITDDVATTILLHQYGALAFWDYATAAPYVQLDMNPMLPGVGETSAHKDAMFFSTHKFIGGVQTPGVLIAKKSLFKKTTSVNDCSGGSVFFVTREGHRYLQDIELREEGCNGAIVESVRAGLVMQLKETIGSPAIMTREEKIVRTVLSHVRTIPELIVLGNMSHNVKRLPIFSFIVRHPRGTFLHHNFVCSVLNDVFGIQIRGGCACVGPYAQDLMGIDPKLAEEYEEILSSEKKEEFDNCEILRPGFSRISFPYFINDAELAFVLEALKMVATEAWKLLPQYILNPETGEWRHHSNSVFRDRKWLGSIRYIDGKMTISERRVSSQNTNCPVDFSECLHVARSIFNKARKMAQRYPVPDQKVMFDEKSEKLRWFMLSSEAQDLLLGHSQNVKNTVPFNPVDYFGSRSETFEPAVTKQETKPPDTPKQSDAQFSQKLNKIFSHNFENLVVPNIPPHMLTQRQNSFSSETSTSEYITDLFTPVPSFSYQNYNSFDNFNGQTVNYDDAFYTQVMPNYIQPNRQYMYPVSQPLELFQTQEELNDWSNAPLAPRTSKVHFSLDLLQQRPDREVTRQRCNSLGSAMLLTKRLNNLNTSRSLTEGGSLNVSECSLSSNSPVPDDIHAYVAEMTKELATEIKSEIREVITTVDNVLSESTDTDGDYKCNDCRLERANSVSASVNDIAEYLMGVSREMAKEMKCEIREMVNSISSECSPKLKREDDDKNGKKNKFLKNSVSKFSQISQSQDSGINLSYSESTCESSCSTRSEKIKESDEERGRSESVDSNSRNRSESCDSFHESEGLNFKKLQSVPKRKISRASKKIEKRAFVSEESSNDEGTSSDGSSKLQNPKAKWHCPSKAIWKSAVEAINEFEMIKDGDKILVCLFGGKDSLSLLHMLHQYQFYASSRGVKFELGAVTVDPGHASYNPRPMIPYIESLGIPHFYEEQCIVDQAHRVDCSSHCNFCSRIKRGRIYAAARRESYNVVAFAHNLDDVAETFLMSAFHNGRLRSMKAHYYVREKDLRVIRPFVYVRERLLKQFAESRKLPVISDVCHSIPKERQRSKQLLAQQEVLFPRLFCSLKAALHPLISYRHTDDESKFYDCSKYTTDSDEGSLP